MREFVARGVVIVIVIVSIRSASFVLMVLTMILGVLDSTSPTKEALQET